jgi:hypothetical protein
MSDSAPAGPRKLIEDVPQRPGPRKLGLRRCLPKTVSLPRVSVVLSYLLGSCVLEALGCQNTLFGESAFRISCSKGRPLISLPERRPARGAGSQIASIIRIVDRIVELVLVGQRRWPSENICFGPVQERLESSQ